MFRVHDVAATRDALAVASATVDSSSSGAPIRLEILISRRFQMDNFEEGRDYEEDRGVGSSDSFVTLEISGLSLFTHHGATEAEQETGQRLVFDVTFDVEDCDATVTDRLEDTIDYSASARRSR